MQDENDSNKSGQSNGEQDKNGNEFAPKWLPRRLFTLIGTLALFIIVVGGGAAFYAYYHVTKDSVRIQFWVGFMFSFMALVVITVQAVIYAQQARFMREQARASSQLIELMALSECPYVTIGKNWTVEPEPLRKNVLVVSSTLVNGGKTPALNLRRLIQVAIGEGTPPVGWGRFEWFEPTTVEPMLLVSGGEVNMANSGVPITDDILADLVSGKQVIVIDGQCRYMDQLGGEQIYRFGLVFDWAKGHALMRYQEYERTTKKG